MNTLLIPGRCILPQPLSKSSSGFHRLLQYECFSLFWQCPLEPVCACKAGNPSEQGMGVVHALLSQSLHG